MKLEQRLARLESQQPEQERVFLWMDEDGTLSGQIPDNRPVTIIAWSTEDVVQA